MSEYDNQLYTVRSRETNICVTRVYAGSKEEAIEMFNSINYDEEDTQVVKVERVEVLSVEE